MMHRDCPEEKKKKLEDFFAALVAGNLACYHCKDDGC